MKRLSPPIAAVLLASALVLGTAPAARADDATARARSHYETGLKLFDAREHEQALIEFDAANQIKSRPAALFMMAQCEYLLGRLKEARAHYQAYITEVPDGEFVELARDRIESIDKRPSTFVINSVPDEVMIRISRENDPGRVVASGQAPNNFSVPRGRYRVDVTKANHQGQTRIVEVDVAETKPLFFKLDPIPARLEIETHPPDATLYVNGNRARNPYRQAIPPGPIEIVAEATDFETRTIDLSLAPGQLKRFVGPERLRLSYRQRSGRPELLIASGFMGTFVGAGAVAAAIGSDLQSPNVATVLLVGGGGVAGMVAGALVATPLVPKYVPDNRALFIIGGMWVGAAEGFGAGLVVQQLITSGTDAVPPCPGPGPCRGSIGESLRAGFVGSLPGLAVGLTTGALFAKRAPNYGRVNLIQSAALGGALAGGLLQIATQWQPYGAGWEYSVRKRGKDMSSPFCTGPAETDYCAYPEHSALDLAPGALIGLNVGLAAGLLGAYLPDQSRYGMSGKRVLLIDLAVGAGAIAGGVAACVANADGCLSASSPDDDARAKAAWAALAGGAFGLLGGVLLTRGIDDDLQAAAPPSTAPPPVATFVPVRDVAGALAPGLGAVGVF